jgi:hypothetical protein
MRCLPLACLLPLLIFAFFSAGEPIAQKPPGKQQPLISHARVPTIKGIVQPIVEREAKQAQALALEQLQIPARVPAHFKLPVARKGLADPWAGFIDLEQSGLRIAQTARDVTGNPSAVLDQLSAAVGKPAGTGAAVTHGKLTTLEDHILYLTAVLDKARALFDEATQQLKPADRRFLFDWAPRIAEHIGPQLPLNEQTRPVLQNDRAFCMLVEKQVDWAKLVGSAQTLLALLDPTYLPGLRAVLEKADSIKEAVPGVTGDILFVRETKHGLILIGGKGANSYDLKKPVALLIDLAGDDTYKGRVASSFDPDHPISVVIDMAGNDLYEGEICGVATGRAGIGILVDLAGKDTYRLATGSGGVGLAGIGVLIDLDGDDIYTGSRCTQGSAIAGIGLLLDRAGNDLYTSFGFALGFGGPLGVGAVIDLDGDDRYQCGKKYPSGYNETDAPNAKPGDANFQWDCFGMATGLGRRVLPPGPEANAFQLAGGLGMILDLKGKDRYESSNFSQACGYFFGVGLKMDFAGDDEHRAARYGHASGAHFGMGLFADYAGNDTYSTTGPTYNGACAWDHSVFLFVDAAGDDVYDTRGSSGVGRADIGSWAVFADLGGKDRYLCPGGLGRASQKSLAVFLHTGRREDDYTLVPRSGDFQPGNGKLFADKDGGVFIDQ